MKKRSNFKVMIQLTGLVKPLMGYMVLAVAMGLAGHLCAAFITIFGGFAVLEYLGMDTGLTFTVIFVSVCVYAVLRGILRYAEQACNHLIAFKLLALIRDKVFGALRRLCPAKLEGKDKGNLISVITSDIELLEVFYAHTISPSAIAFLFSVIFVIFIGNYHWTLGALALLAYVTVGIMIPVGISKASGEDGMRFRGKSGELSSFVLDSLRGLSEILQYGMGGKRLAEMNEKTDALVKDEERMKKFTGRNMAITNTVILIFDISMLLLSAYWYQVGAVDFEGVLIPVVALMSSFGPVVALANLGSTLQNTFASGNRVLDILEESPVVEEITGQPEVVFAGAQVEHVTFSYMENGGSTDMGENNGANVGKNSGTDDGRGVSVRNKGEADKNSADSIMGNRCNGKDMMGEKETILQDVSVAIPKNSVVGIVGRSGSGKSTLLKLLMRFWSVQQGKVSLSDTSVEQINTDDLRQMESFVPQSTHLFHDSIANNLRLAKLDATQAELEAACKKASVHDFVMSLPRGYETPVGELGDSLSGGERQRLGLARAFLHNAPLMLLDEPTSNLDSLNEAVILKSLREERDGKTVVLVSHRQSTMRIADTVYSVENGRMS